MSIQELYKIFSIYPAICIDSRNIVNNSIFFALKGKNFNGNHFSEEAIRKGAQYVIIDEEKYKISDKCILVKDVLNTLQKLANYHRKQLNIPFIGITGTNGKTTTKELVNAVLSKKYKTTATKGNFNNHIGVPLTILSIPIDCEIAIIEMGANHVGEIDFACKIAEPNFGIITNIGRAHIEGFGSEENIITTKSELYKFIKENGGELFINNSDKLLINLAKKISAHTYGENDAECNGKIISSSPFLTLEWKNNSIKTHLYGKYNADNILAAICIGEYFKVSDKKIVEAISNYQPKNNRSEIIRIKSNTYYLDAYNANPSSMDVAIETFAENNAQNKLMILGDMLELGKTSVIEHQKIVDTVKKLNIKTLFVGDHFNAINKEKEMNFVKNYDKAINYIIDQNIKDTHILIKGSRGLQLEKITTYFSKNS